MKEPMILSRYRGIFNLNILWRRPLCQTISKAFSMSNVSIPAFVFVLGVSPFQPRTLGAPLILRRRKNYYFLFVFMRKHFMLFMWQMVEPFNFTGRINLYLKKKAPHRKNNNKNEMKTKYKWTSFALMFHLPENEWKKSVQVFFTFLIRRSGLVVFLCGTQIVLFHYMFDADKVLHKWSTIFRSGVHSANVTERDLQQNL